MDLMRKRKDSKSHLKKEKKLKKLINKPESDSDESEHELSYYLNDRVKLMKEVLKIIKPKKIKSMAPECIKNLDNEEINSMLLEELLGISNKRLKYIFNGQNLEEDSSSTDPEAEQQPIDVISLDDITDDDFIIDLDSENEEDKKRHKKHGKIKIKEECKRKKVKKEKQEKPDHSKSSKKSKNPEKTKMDEQNLMSVLELLELQARARAIRSQLALESSKKTREQEKTEINETRTEESDNDDAIIIESPKNIEIVITSSESETEVNMRSGYEKPKTISKQKNNCGGNEKGRTSQGDSDLKEDNAKDNEKEESNSNKQLSSELVQKSDESSETLDSEKREIVHEIKEIEVETSENKNIETATKPVDDSRNQLKNKITNVETIIISPAKNPTVSNNAEKDKKIKKGDEQLRKNKSEMEKSNENSEEEKAKANNKELKREKNDWSKSEIHKIQNNVPDESDGIIINMEQSEIDCIISD